MRRSSADHRVVLAANLDRIDAASALWAADGELDPGAIELGDALRSAIATELTGKQREAVEAYFFEGASQDEIARRLGISQQVVQKRLFGVSRGGKNVGGALARLRRVLAPLRSGALGAVKP